MKIASLQLGHLATLIIEDIGKVITKMKRDYRFVVS